MPLLLTDSDVNQVMTMQDCVGVMEDMLDQAHRGMAWFQPRSHIRTPVGYHHIMPGALLDSGVVGLKVYTARFPAGSRFLTVLHDSQTGDLLALLQGAGVLSCVPEPLAESPQSTWPGRTHPP